MLIFNKNKTNCVLLPIKYRAEFIYIVFFTVFLCGCTSGRYYPTHSPENISLEQESTLREKISHTLEHKDVQQCLDPGLIGYEQRKNTVFVHPGWIFIINWGGGRARDAGLLLVRDGFAGSILEVRSRETAEIYERMINDSGSRYLGLHYSMGGSPKVLQAALDAAVDASELLNNHIIYSPILIEPHNFSSLPEFIELDNPHLGNIIVVVSGDNSFLRPNINGASDEILRHPKLNFLYAEDFGLDWGHFSFLSDIRNSEIETGIKHDRAIEIFHALATLLQANVKTNDIKILLAHLKVKYAFEDGRDIQRAWIQLGIVEWDQLSYLCKWEDER